MNLLHFESIIDFVQDEGGAKVGQKAGFHVMLKYFEIKTHSVTRSATPHVPLICSYHILTSSVMFY